MYLILPECVVVVQSLSRVRLLQPHGVQPARLLCPQDSPGKNNGVAISFCRRSNLSLLCLLHWQAGSLPLATLGKPHLNVQQVSISLSSWNHPFLQLKKYPNLSLIQLSLSVLSNSSRHHGLWHATLPCPSPSQSLPRLMSIELVMRSNHLILCCPLLLLPSIFPGIRVFTNE